MVADSWLRAKRNTLITNLRQTANTEATGFISKARCFQFAFANERNIDKLRVVCVFQRGREMDVYHYLIEQVKLGTNFNVDFSTNSLNVGRKSVIKEGVVQDGFKLREFVLGEVDKDWPLMRLEQMYEVYKDSVPTKNSRDGYFKAKTIDELTDEDLVNGEPREVAQAKLEGTILCMKLTGQLEWDESWGKWFYQSPTDKDFVLLRSWFE